MKGYTSRRRWAVLWVAMGCLFPSVIAVSEPLSITRKTEIPLYQEKTMTRAVVTGAASGVAIGAGVGFMFRQMMCSNGSCPSTAKTVVPSLLIGTVVGAGVGALIKQTSGRDAPFMVYPNIGIGTYDMAPAIIFEGHF